MDDKIWSIFVQDIKKLENKKVLPEHSNSPPIPRNKNTINDIFLYGKTISETLPKEYIRKIKKQKTSIDATIDLHGLTIDIAHNVVKEFITNCFHSDKRNTLIITGKGSLQNNSTLKKLLPQWLKTIELSNMVIGFNRAEQKHGGDGAFYVKLRKK
jgi:DNA-nicking Smr family endonuclease